MVSFIVQKLLSLIRSHLFLPLFLIFWEVGHRGSCCDLSGSVLPMFSSKSFLVSGLTLRSSICFEFIFVYGVRECSNFILLHVAVQFSQHYLLKRLSFLHCYILAYFVIGQVTIGLSLDFLCRSIDLYFCVCLDYRSFIV